MKLFKNIIPERLLQNEQSLDVPSILCERVWEVFNDEGVKQVLIFKSNGDLLISTDGDVSNGSWNFISSNQALIISSKDGGKMYHPVYLDGTIFAFQLDGKKDTLFLIDEKDHCFDTIDELKEYYYSKELVLNKEVKDKEEEEKRAVAIKEHKDKMRLQAGIEMPSRNCFDVFALLFFAIVFIAPILLILIRVVVRLVFHQEVFDGILDFYGLLWEKGLYFVFIPFAVIISQSRYSGLTSGYYFERTLALIELRENDYSSYCKANKLKIIPVLVRLFGWITALMAGCLTIIRADISYMDLKWWHHGGYSMGAFLGCLFWIWIWCLVARTIEKRLFGTKLPWSIMD